MAPFFRFFSVLILFIGCYLVSDVAAGEREKNRLLLAPVKEGTHFQTGPAARTRVQPKLERLRLPCLPSPPEYYDVELHGIKHHRWEANSRMFTTEFKVRNAGRTIEKEKYVMYDIRPKDRGIGYNNFFQVSGVELLADLECGDNVNIHVDWYLPGAGEYDAPDFDAPYELCISASRIEPGYSPAGLERDEQKNNNCTTLEVSQDK